MQGRRPHEPAEFELLVSRSPAGGLLFRTRTTPGWSMRATCPAEVARAIECAMAEVQIAAYAAWRGVVYDLAETEEEIPAAAYRPALRHPSEPPPVEAPADEVAVRRRKKHPRTHAPEDWRELSDGRWLSPTGRRYGPDTAVVAAVVAARSTAPLPGEGLGALARRN